MRNFDYAAPTSLSEATAILVKGDGQARVMAGGTDLLVQLRERLRAADLVVDLKRIPELLQLDHRSGDGLRLGAAVPCYRIYEDEEIAADYTALAEAARIVGGWQIQSRASVGGNLCNSSPAGDTIAPLVAFGAKCFVIGPEGAREIAAESFCTGPGKNVLRPGEILKEIVLPATGARHGSAYERFIPRNEMDIAVAGAASWVELNEAATAIERARVAVSAVAPTVRLAEEASNWLSGKPITEETFAQAGELAKKVAAPISDMRGPAEYRVHLTGVLVRRTLEKAVARARA